MPTNDTIAALRAAAASSDRALIQTRRNFSKKEIMVEPYSINHENRTEGWIKRHKVYK
ncbi:hypothetical protein [Nonlabens xiamenensis]|uniref:hypothetical protein n=1 Tax=Nonlabens xiamenensis TaxID=2341043 RepID=UPI0013DDC525|nr:hypothetical protein [Nonlabens xiamenensis]